MRLLGKSAIFVVLTVVLVGAAAGNAIAGPAEVHRFTLNEWRGLSDEKSYSTMSALGGASQTNNTGRSSDGSTRYPGGPIFSGTPPEFACIENSAVSPVDTAGCGQGYKFNTGEGLSLAGANLTAGGPYSIVIDFMFTSSSSLFKVLDFNGLCGDSISNTDVNNFCNAGLYVSNNNANRRLLFAQSDGTLLNGSIGTIAGTRMSRVVLTRGDGAANRVKVWDDEISAGSALDFADTAGDTTFSLSTVLNFFIDDEVLAGANQGAGYVDTIRVFNYALTGTDIAALTETEDFDRGPYSDVPEPGSLLLLGTGLAVVGARLRKRAAR